MSRHNLLIIMVGLALLSCGVFSFGAGARRQPQVSMLMQKLITPPANTEVSVLRVELPPAATAPPHTHPGPTFGYVLDGELQFQLEGGPLAVYHAGQTFYEPAHAVHLVSRNPSKTAPVTFLAFFVGEQGKPVLRPVSQERAATRLTRKAR